MAPLTMIIAIVISIATIPMGGVHEITKQQTTIVDRVAPAGGAGVSLSDLPGVGSEQIEAATLQKEYVAAGENHQVWKVIWTGPYRYSFQIADLNIGVLFILAVLSLSVYGVVIGGWASNNKYSFLGGLRATANMISYEIPLGLAVLCIVVMFGTLNLETIVEQQAGYWAGVIPAWNVFSQPLAFVLFLICIHAEANRAPFDMAEAEQELVGGYHTEYSSMRFALFFLAEYAGMITTSAVLVCLFFGGWHVPGLDRLVVGAVNHFGHSGAWVDSTNPAVTNSLILCIVRAFVVFGKTLVVIFVFMWTRWSLPRFRFDQLMMLAWRALIPISLALLIVTALIVYIVPPSAGSPLMIDGYTALVLFAGNIAVLAGAMIISMFLPAAPLTNRKVRIPGSRFNRGPLTAKPVSA